MFSLCDLESHWRFLSMGETGFDLHLQEIALTWCWKKGRQDCGRKWWECAREGWWWLRAGASSLGGGKRCSRALNSEGEESRLHWILGVRESEEPRRTLGFYYIGVCMHEETKAQEHATPKIIGLLLSNCFTDLYFHLYTFVWDYARNMCYFDDLKAI